MSGVSGATIMSEAVVVTVDEKTLRGMKAIVNEKCKVLRLKRMLAPVPTGTHHVCCGECQELAGGSAYSHRCWASGAFQAGETNVEVITERH